MYPMDAQLAAELAAMAKEDERVRALPPGQERDYVCRVGADQLAEMQRVDERNSKRLREIINANGWPGYSLVGEQGASDVWGLAQHADPGFQSELLDSLTYAVAHGEASPRHLAFMTDRLRMRKRRRQLYGTQMIGEADGRLAPWPIEDPDRLDERRAAVGLEPFAEYAARRGLATGPTNSAAAD
jgi:hypothetical protein